MLLTTKARYAIIACIDLANLIGEEQNRKVSVYEIAEKQKISIAYLEQIFAKLRHGGILTATKGPNGGYTFAKGISDINLLDIINAVDENIKMTNCEECKHIGRTGEQKSKCDGHAIWKALGNTINNFFAGITIQKAIDGNFNTDVC